MALDIKGFVTPEQEFPGLGKLGEVFAQQKQRKAAEAERAGAQAKATQSYLSTFLDPKEFMTATVNDPYIQVRISKLLDKGMELAKIKGMDSSMLYAALSPEVNSLARDTQTIKELERQRKGAEESLKGKKGIDIPKFNEMFKRRAYFGEDGKLKMELSQLDPTYNYVDEVLGNDDVYTSEGIDEWVKKQGANTTSADKIIQGGNKAYRRAKLEVTAPYFMQPKEEKGVFTGEFEPKHEYWAQDGQEMESEVIDPITGKPVLGTNGKPIKEKVKLLDPKTYEAILADPDNRAAAAYINQEVRKMTKGLGISPNSDNYNMYARKIAYDVLSNAARPKTSYKEIVEQKAATAPKITVNVGGGGKGNGDVEINDVYSEIDTKLNRGSKMFRQGESSPAGLTYRLPLNELSATAQKAILKYARELTGNEFVTQGMYKIQRDENGNVNLLTKDNEIVAPIDFKDMNLPTQSGVKAKQKVVSESNKKEVKPQKIKLEKGSLDNIK